jgi:hypothetical protein
MFKIVYSQSMVQPYFTKWYKNRKVAQNACDKLNARYAKSGHGENVFAVYSQEEYAAAVKGKGEWKTAIIGGGKVWVALGTPACCDPSTETYASM